MCRRIGDWAYRRLRGMLLDTIGGRRSVAAASPYDRRRARQLGMRTNTSAEKLVSCADSAWELSPGRSAAEPWVSGLIWTPALKERKRRNASRRVSTAPSPFLAIMALIILCLGWLTIGGRAEPTRLEAAVEQANRALNEGKIKEAEKQTEAVLKLYPDKPEAWNLRGAILIKQQRLDEAAEKFTKALQLDPKFYAAQYNLAQVYLLENKFDDAQARFQELQTVDPNSELLQFKVILCNVLKGQEDKSSTLIDVMKFPGQTPAYYYARAAVALKKGLQESAHVYLANARKYYSDAQCAFFDQELKQVGLLTTARKPSPTPAAKP